MPDQNTPQEVQTTEVIKGQIKWFGNPRNPVPTVMANVGKAIRYGCTGMIACVNSAPKDMFTLQQTSAWSWWLSVIIIMSGVIELLVGVEPAKRNVILIWIVLTIAIRFLL